MSSQRYLIACLLTAVCLSVPSSAFARDLAPLLSRMRESCLDCHSGDEPEGGFSLSQLAEQLDAKGTPAEADLAIWIKIHDRVDAGEMPPEGGLDDTARQTFVSPLRERLIELDRQQIENEGRAIWRRMNRFEYENSLRDLLHAPWLQLASMLPEDGELHRFNKLGLALDVSHINFARYMQAADYALREVMAKETERRTQKTVRYYAREQESFNKRVHFTNFNRSRERATFPLLGYDADLDVLRDPQKPFTVGNVIPKSVNRKHSVSSPAVTNRSKFASASSRHLGAGRYKLRFKGYHVLGRGRRKEVVAGRPRTDFTRPTIGTCRDLLAITATPAATVG